MSCTIACPTLRARLAYDQAGSYATDAGDLLDHVGDLPAVPHGIADQSPKGGAGRHRLQRGLQAGRCPCAHAQVEDQPARFLCRRHRTGCGANVFGILQGILLAALASIFLLLACVSQPNVAILGRLPGTGRYADSARHPDVESLSGILAFRTEASLLYLNAERQSWRPC